MAMKKPPLPPELANFIKKGETTFHCDDGDWDLKIARAKESDFKEELPSRAIMIAENGCGDCLYLNVYPGNKFAPKVFVYWHEEDRKDFFAKSIKELIATSAKNKAAAAERPAPAKAPASKKSSRELEKKLSSVKGHKRWSVIQEFYQTEFGLEVLPLLRRLLAEDDASMVIHAAECIAKLGPEAATCPAGKASEIVADGLDWKADLISQLRLRGAQVWSYSGYANAYSACLNALVKLNHEPEYVVDFVQTHVGLSSMDLVSSLEALKAIGTPEARDLAKRALAFWLPELNMSETKKAKAIVASIGTKTPTGAKKKKK
jgi:hypothetical protein